MKKQVLATLSLLFMLFVGIVGIVFIYAMDSRVLNATPGGAYEENQLDKAMLELDALVIESNELVQKYQ